LFIAKSEYLKKIKNIAQMASEMHLSIYIFGEKGVGKTFLANYIAKNSNIKPIILENFDKNPNFDIKEKFIIATGEKELNKDILKKFFSLEIYLKPLRERKEDINHFIEYFLDNAKKELKIKKEIKIKSPDISENLNSLKRQIYKKLLFSDSKDEILNNLKEIYLNEHKSYEEELQDFEKTLFSAMREKYKTKLKISENLKINRVTLTKKMKALNV